MKTRNTALLLLALCGAASARAVVPDPATRIHADVRGILRGNPASRADGEDETQAEPYRPLILQIDDEATVDSLRAMDVIIYHRRDDLLLTSVPADSLERVLSLHGLVDAASTASMSMTLDLARPFNHVDRVQDPEAAATLSPALPRPYTGKGVVTGFSDTGFDPHHIAFAGRMAAVYDYNTPCGEMLSATTPAQIAEWTTDDPDNYHATHVCGIMAGGYKGCPYWGVATDAEIVGTTSRLHDVGILSGVEEVIAYAREKGKRAVVNLSLSSHSGAHDGTSLLCQYLSRCAQDAVLCVSAGNSGHINCFASQTLTGAEEAAVTVNNYRTWDGFEVSGYTDVWSDTDAPLEVSLQVYDTDTQQTVYATEWAGGEGYTMLSDVTEDGWTDYMSGLLYAEYGWSRTNGRYNVSVVYNTVTEEVSARGQWSRYLSCIRVRKAQDGSGSSGPTAVMFFSDAGRSYLGTVPGTATVVDSRGSINDMCTASGVIGVGMACSRNSVPLADGLTRTWNMPVDRVINYSSYSDVPWIKPLPVISAAGSYLISACSGPYALAHPNEPFSAITPVDGEDYYWIATGGTSMSSPLVAGIVAQWLEADPTLTTDDIIDIATSTAMRDFPDISDPRWGAGNIDAYAGICEVLRRAGTIAPEMPVDISIGADRRLVIRGIDPSVVRVYTVSGMEMDATRQLHPGVYIVAAQGLGARRLAVR